MWRAKEYNQPFYCEKCTQSGYVGVFNGDDVYSIINRIRAEHKRISPDCEWDLDKVRVVNVDEVLSNREG